MSKGLHVIAGITEMRAAMAAVKPAIPSRSTLPVLKCVKIEANARLYLTGTDLSVAVKVPVDGAAIENPGSIAVHAQAFHDILSALGGDEVEMMVDEATTTLVLSTPSSRIRLQGILADEFPPMETGGAGDIEVTLKSDDFAGMIGKVAYAASRDESWPVYTGILVEFSEDELALVATDGYRLSMASAEIETGALPIQLNVPAPSMTMLEKLLGKVSRYGPEGEKFILVIRHRPSQQKRLIEEEAKETKETVSSVGFISKYFEISTQVIDAEFADWRKILPADGRGVTVTALADEVLAGLRLLKVYLPKEDGVVYFRVGDGLTLMSQDIELGAGIHTVQAEHTKSALSAYNWKYLKEAVSSLGTDQVRFELDGEQPNNLPILLRPVGHRRDMSIIMPMRLGERLPPDEAEAPILAETPAAAEYRAAPKDNAPSQSTVPSNVGGDE